MFGDDEGVGQRHDGPDRERRHEREHGRRQEQEPVRARRHHDLFQEHLDDVGERLQHALPADAVRADADVHPGEDLALPVREVRDAEDQRHEHDDDLQRR